jgi:hypothetical protein
VADRAAATVGELPNRKATTMRTQLLVKVVLGTTLYLTIQLAALYLLARTLVSGLFGLP